MEDLFNEILEKNEKIIKVIKPHKGRYMKNFLIPFIIPLLWPHLILTLVFTLFTPFYFIPKGYKNIYYAYTNKRLIVRKGIFGNNYDSLEYKDITSTSVKVGYLDRKSKTGTLIFVNPSSHHEHPMKFAHIQNPYQEMNEIKEIINETNEKTLSKW